MANSISSSVMMGLGGLAGIGKSVKSIVKAQQKIELEKKEANREKYQRAKERKELRDLMKNDYLVKEAIKTYKAKGFVENVKMQEIAKQNLLDVVNARLRQKKQFNDRISKFVLKEASKEDEI